MTDKIPIYVDKKTSNSEVIQVDSYSDPDVTILLQLHQGKQQPNQEQQHQEEQHQDEQQQQLQINKYNQQLIRDKYWARMIRNIYKVIQNVNTMNRRVQIWFNVKETDLKISKHALSRKMISKLILQIRKELPSVIILQLLYEKPMSYDEITEKIKSNPILKIGFDFIIIKDAVKRCVKDLRYKQLLIAIPRKRGELWFEWSYSLMKVYNEQQPEQQSEPVVVSATYATVYIGYGEYILIDSNDQQFDLIQQFGMSPKILKRKGTPISEETRTSLWNLYTEGESLLKKQKTDYDEPVIV